jgi:signal transduction histidine kinase
VKSAETQGITGTGLGLWITVEMVRQMKGVISVESIKGKGTDFILTFPIVK